jgi:hypothetical protein
MKIQFNAGKEVKGDNKFTDSQIAEIESSLSRFGEMITHLDAKLSKEDAAKNGINTNRCTLEALLQDRRPIAVSDNADTYDGAIRGALGKLTASLDDFG